MTKASRLNGLEPEVVQLGKGITEDDLLFHDEKSVEPSLAYLLSRMRYEDGYPEPIGVFRSVSAPMYDELINDQINVATQQKGIGDLDTPVHLRRHLGSRVSGKTLDGEGLRPVAGRRGHLRRAV